MRATTTRTFSRRSILRGLGAGSLLLPGIWKNAAAAPGEGPKNAAFFFYANGAHPDWAPQGSGTNFTLTNHLKGLEPIRNDVIIFRRLMAQRNTALNPHKGATIDTSSAGNPESIDQTIAMLIKKEGGTPVPSLELAIGRSSGGGGVVPSLSRLNGQFLPGIRNPLFADQRLAGAISPGNPMTKDPMGSTMEKGLVAKKSLLDFLKDDVGVLRMRAGGRERLHMDSYLDAIRDLEGKLGNFAGEVKPTASCSKGAAPATAMDFEAHCSDLQKVNHMFLDTIAMGFACGVTRVSSMMWGGGECAEPVSWMGVGSWHSVSHQNPNSAGQATLIKLQSYFCEELAYFMGKMKTFGLFDNTVAILGTQNGNSTESGFSKETHDRHNAMFILAGRGGGYFNSLGKVVDCNDLAHTDLYHHVANAFGYKGNTFGNPAWSKGPLPGVV
jgi:Protein of unknown function (DUF1552)